jgi:hypothetical protein
MRDGSIWREREEREPSRSEVVILSPIYTPAADSAQLFFDLIFVGIIRQLSEGATEEFSGQNIATFVRLSGFLSLVN